MATNATQESWLASAPGRWINPDNAYGYQCVDVADDYAEAIFPGIGWAQSIGGVPGARAILDAASDKYFTRIDNDLNNPNLIPQRGDIIVFDGSPINEWGHVAIVLSATSQNVTVIQQDGFLQTAAAIGTLPYWGRGTGYVKGWLRPKLGLVDAPAPAPAPAPAATGSTLRGIDISMHQKGINVAAVAPQFVFVKATEGVGYTDPEFDTHVTAVRAAGIPLGFYHMCRPVGPENSPQAEAAWFVSVVSKYLKNGDKVAADWEMENVQNTGWLKDFLNEVQRLTGLKGLAYMNLSVATTYNWSAVQSAGYKLWLAQYPTTAQTSWAPVAAQPTPAGWNVAIWQHSSTGRLNGYNGDLDVNVLNGSWDSIGSGSVVLPASAPAPVAVDPNTRTVTNEVAWVRTAPRSDAPVAPAYPEGIARGEHLAVTGYVKGQDPYGDGNNSWYQTRSGFYVWTNAAEDRIDGLTYLGDKSGAVKQCVVSPDDTMTAIAAQFGVSLAALKSANPGINYDVIQPGQVLNLP